MMTANISQVTTNNVQLYLRSTAASLLIAGVAAGITTHSIAAMTDGGETRLPPQFFKKEFPMSPLPVTAKEMLTRIKLALDQDLFLREEFYSDENLKNFLGNITPLGLGLEMRVKWKLLLMNLEIFMWTRAE